MGTRSRVAVASARIGALAGFLVATGAIGAALGWLPPMTGFNLVLLGGLPVAALCLLLGIIGLVMTRKSTGKSGREQAFAGCGISAGLMLLLAMGASDGQGLPPINDITTNPLDAPSFVVAALELGDPLAYPGEPFAAQQRKAYPDLAPIELEMAPAAALEHARAAAEAIGLEVVAVDPTAGTLEARGVSSLFHFIDDVAVRVRPTPQGSVLDVRSRSRDGRGDLGVNARRIQALGAALR